jgi:hypothetical protein
LFGLQTKLEETGGDTEVLEPSVEGVKEESRDEEAKAVMCIGSFQ